MPLPRLRKLEVQGFRSFGTGRQSFDVSETVTVLWGGNSQGKSSLAEALEFLFTGEIVRRELLASQKDEFADSLRNAHIPAATPVTVEATIDCPDGVSRRLRRSLVDDFKGSTACTSRIEIDGKASSDGDLFKQLGVKLMPAPLRAPVLAQHTLGYIFSAAPVDRAAYIITAPCGEPCVGVHRSRPFRISAFSQPRIRSRTRPSLTFASTRAINASCGIESKYACKSASTT